MQAIGQQNELQHLKLLSSKPFLIIANISENDIIDPYKNCQAYRSLVDYYGNEKILPVSAKIESELSQMDEEEAQMYAGELGINESGLKKIIRATYKNLGLITFFTCGPKEIHAWPIENGITIKQAAGVIHSDLEKGFICAHVFSCDDIFMYKSEHGIKQAGKFKTVGSDYIVVDGDIVHVQFNV